MDFTADIFIDWADWLEENQEQIRIFAEELGKAVKPVTELATALGSIAWEAIKLAITVINEGLQGIAESVIQLDSSKIIILASTLTGVAVAVNAVKTAMDFFGLSLMEVITLSGIPWDYFEDKYLGGIKYYLDEARIALTKLLDIMKQRGVVELLGIAFNTLKNAIKPVWTLLTTNPIAKVIALTVTLAASVIKAYKEFEVFREYIRDTFNVAKEAFSGIAEAFNEMFDGSIKPVCEAISPAIKTVINVFKTAWTAISTIIGIIVTVIGGTLLSVFVNTFAEIAKGVFNAIGSVVDILSGLITFIKGVFTGDMDKALKGLLQLFTGLGKSLQNIFRTTFNIIAGFFNGFIRGLTNAINMVIKAINRINIKIPDWVPGIGGKKFGGFNIGTIPARTIPLLANGGVITKPTVAMMGEYAGAT
jgi:phage-related protein